MMEKDFLSFRVRKHITYVTYSVFCKKKRLFAFIRIFSFMYWSPFMVSCDKILPVTQRIKRFKISDWWKDSWSNIIINSYLISYATYFNNKILNL